MNFLTPKMIQTTVFIVLGGLFLGVLWLGFNNGRFQAQSKAELTRALNFQQALAYFYSDQERYPSQEEFADRTIMSWYVRNLTGPNLVSKRCPEPPRYSSLSLDTYKYTFCLPSAYKNFLPGPQLATPSTNLTTE